ncbi:MAG: hypothetical protein LBC21_04675 [Oscillospiraceae bacterium]|jgi:hypothetical protein|nr:hypothetical protein [Oscillospiraceae bacterium]
MSVLMELPSLGGKLGAGAVALVFGSGNASTVDLSQYAITSDVIVTVVGGGFGSADGGGGGMVVARLPMADVKGKALTVSAASVNGTSFVSTDGLGVLAGNGSATYGGSGGVSGTAVAIAIVSGKQSTAGQPAIPGGSWTITATTSSNLDVIAYSNPSPYIAYVEWSGYIPSTGQYPYGTITVPAGTSGQENLTGVKAGVKKITANGQSSTGSSSLVVTSASVPAVPAQPAAPTVTVDGAGYGAGGASGDSRGGCVRVDFNGYGG